MSVDIVEKAREFAKKSHYETNHLYDGKPYFDAHVVPVVEWAEKYLYLYPKKIRPLKRAIAYCHDTLEDTRVTYNQLKRATSCEVADGVFALTNFRGKTRDERAPDEYYHGIVEADVVLNKLADRAANMINGLATGHSMVEGYKKEYAHFKELLQKDLLLARPWAELDSLHLNKLKLNRVREHSIVVGPENEHYVVRDIDNVFIDDELHVQINCYSLSDVEKGNRTVLCSFSPEQVKPRINSVLF